MERRFRVFKRSLKKQKVYYARLLDTSGTIAKTISTGQTNKYAAIQWCEDYLNTKQEKQSSISFAEYSTGFWEKTGEYAQSKLTRGYTISNGYLDISKGYTHHHLFPEWGKYNLSDFTPGQIDAWVLRLYKESNLAPATINKLLQTLRTILEQATATGLIDENPAKYVKPVKLEYTERGIFTPDELSKLINSPNIWLDFRHYALNLIAAVTGMRMGEIRGLLVKNVHNDHISVLHSWEEGYGLKEPKFGSVRDIPISPFVFNILNQVIVQTQPQELLFYAENNPQNPISKSYIEKHFYAALKNIGIDEETRKERKLVFHSYRHSLNTILRSRGVADSKIRKITGHKDERIQDHYTHYLAHDFTEILQVQDALVGGAL